MKRFMPILAACCLALGPLPTASAALHSGDTLPNDTGTVEANIGDLALDESFNLRLAWRADNGISYVLDSTRVTTNGDALLVLPVNTLGYELPQGAALAGEFFAIGSRPGNFTATITTPAWPNEGRAALFEWRISWSVDKTSPTPVAPAAPEPAGLPLLVLGLLPLCRRHG